MVGSLTTVVNQHHELCSLHKPGGVPTQGDALLECVQYAATLVAQRLSILERTLEAHAQRVEAAAMTLSQTGRLPNARLIQSAVAVGSARLGLGTSAPDVIQDHSGGKQMVDAVASTQKRPRSAE